MTSPALQAFYDVHTFFFCFMLFILYLIIHSDVFLDGVLSKFDGALVGNYATTYGTLIQGGTLLGSYIAMVMIASTTI